MNEVPISRELYDKLVQIGIIDDSGVRMTNVGSSNYAEHLIQPWAIWIDWNLDPWDADIVKRVLRTKEGEPRGRDYEKIIHDCQEKLRQLETNCSQAR